MLIAHVIHIGLASFRHHVMLVLHNCRIGLKDTVHLLAYDIEPASGDSLEKTELLSTHPQRKCTGSIIQLKSQGCFQEKSSGIIRIRLPWVGKELGLRI